MARKQVPPPGPKRGGRGKSLYVAPPAPPRGRKAKLGTMAGRAGAPPPLPPPPRPRATRSMGPPVQNPLPRLSARGPLPAAAEERTESTPMGAAMAAGVGGSPMRRAVARGMRSGRVAF